MNTKKKLDYRRCVICGEKFIPGSWNAKYCLECGIKIRAKRRYVYKKKKRK